MEIWLSLPFLPSRELLDIAAAAETSGIDGVAISDHVGVPATLESSYPYASGSTTMPIDTSFPDPLITIAALGAVTSRLRFTTHVLLVPLRHPVLLAREVATTADLLNGRLDLGVGVGWMREEFDAVGVPFEQRGRLMDELIPLLRQLWSGRAVAHAGKHYSFDAVAVNPTPPGPVPILVGGYSDAAIRRAARLGDGWVGVNPSVEDIVVLLERLRQARAEAGTASQPFHVRTGTKGRITEAGVRALRDVGVDSLVITPWQVAPGASIYDISPSMITASLPELVERIRAA